MKKLKSRNIVSLVLNIIAIALIVSGIVCTTKETGFSWQILYTNPSYLTNLLVGLFAFIGIIFNIVRLAKKKNIQCGFIYAFQLMISVLALAAGLFAGLYLQPNHAEGISIAKQCMVCSFYFTPSVLFIVTFLFFETEKVRNWAYSLLAPVLFVLYSAALILCQTMGWMDQTLYGGFFNISKWLNGTDWWRAAVMIVTIIVGGFGVGFGFLAINRAMSKKSNPIIDNEEVLAPVSETPVEEVPVEEPAVSEEAAPVVDETAVPVEPEVIPEEPKAEEKPKAKKVPVKKASEKKQTAKAAQTKKEPAKTPSKKAPADADEPRVYHVSKRSDNHQWQVKFANGKKAIKFFKTQAEAVEYAKQLTETQGGSIRVHSLKGKIKKNS